MNISTDIFEQLPKVDEAAIDALLLEEIRKNEKKIVVLDDDPTGGQTTHDLVEYTNWSKESIRKGFQEDNNLFLILTNSRGCTRERSIEIHKEVVKNVQEVAEEMGKEYIFISRSDSTLRGHYPVEMEIVRDEYSHYTGKIIDGEILCPFFKEGGRFTFDDVHYVRYGDTLVPAGETEFAKDPTFGYKNSNLKAYIEEKTSGEFKASSVTSISLADLRDCNYEKITEQLLSVRDFNKIIANIADYVDMKVFCISLYRAMSQGKSYMIRTAASMVKVMCGNEDQPLLTGEQMKNPELSDEGMNNSLSTDENVEKFHPTDATVQKAMKTGGVIVVGSHTSKTTLQLKRLMENENIVFEELNATLVKENEAFAAEVERCLHVEEEAIKAGRTVCIYTSRDLITADTGDKEDELRLSVVISDAMQSLVGRLSIAPSFVIAKGGNTSSDIAIKALGIQRAYVLGQIMPGTPVWRAGEESKFPGIPYVVFPGNVGDEFTLLKAVEKLM